MPKVVTMCEGVSGRGGLESGRSTKEACAPRTALPGPSATKTQRARQATQTQKEKTQYVPSVDASSGILVAVRRSSSGYVRVVSMSLVRVSDGAVQCSTIKAGGRELQAPKHPSTKSRCK